MLQIRSSNLPTISNSVIGTTNKQQRPKVNLRYGKMLAESVDNGALIHRERSKHRRMVRESYEEDE